MLIGYYRNWPSGPKKQRETLEAAGCEKLYGEATPKAADRLKERQYATRTLRPGDELVIVAPEVLGRNQAEILEAMSEVHRISDGGAVIRDLSTGETVAWTPDVQGPLDFVARGVASLMTRRNRAGNEASRTRSGRKKALQGRKHAEAKADWHNPDLSGPQVAEKHGVSVQTLHSYFGPRSASPEG